MVRCGWKRALIGAWGFCFVLVAMVNLRGAPEPVGLWEFDAPADVLGAAIGNALVLEGQHLAIPGMDEVDGAVRIGAGSHYRCAHGISPNGSGNAVNQFTLLFDHRIPRLGPWYCFYQTQAANQNDGDCFIRANDGAFGVGQTGYSATTAQTWIWRRLLVVVDNSAGVYRLYLDGEPILEGAPQAVDGRFSLDSAVLFFADENGEDAPIDVTRIAIFDRALTAADAVELGAPQIDDPDNAAPTILPLTAGPALVGTGELNSYSFTAADPDGELVQVRVDWGDGELSGWSALVASGEALAMSHSYRQPGEQLLRAAARDQRGKAGGWVGIQTVVVEGVALVEYLTPPYLQNVRMDGITIMWECDLAAEASVDYGVDLGFGARQAGTLLDSGAGTHIYKAVLRGLQPGRTYQYRLNVGGQDGPGGVFATAPLGTPAFAFGVWSDSQGHNHGAYPADPLEPTKSMMRHMAAGGVDFAVGVGDLAENGNSYADTRQFYLDRVARLLGGAVPWFAAWGNHDAGRTAVIRRFADMPSQGRAGFDAGYGSFSFDYAGCHFICLDHASALGDIRGWLETDLRSEASLNARFTFLFVHVPPYCELWIDGDAVYRDELVPLLETYGVDLCFSGHTHEYSRGYLHGVHYCITGGGSWLDLPEVLVRDWDHMTVGGYHPIPGVPQYDSTRGGGLINEYVRVEVYADAFSVSMIGFAPEGTELGVLDAFTNTPEQAPLRIVSIVRSGPGVELEWMGPPGPYQIQFQPGFDAGPWVDVGEPLEASERSAHLPADRAAGWYRIRLAR